jgi:BMFP domain-containing protein YqiC
MAVERTILARIAALEARARRAHPMPSPDRTVVVEHDEHTRRGALEDAERRVTALEARVWPIVQRGARRP